MKKHNKIITVTRSKLNSIESKISEALLNNEITHDYHDYQNYHFVIIINEIKKPRELKESIRMMSSQKSDIEKLSLIEEGKKMNEIINNSLK